MRSFQLHALSLLIGGLAPAAVLVASSCTVSPSGYPGVESGVQIAVVFGHYSDVSGDIESIDSSTQTDYERGTVVGVSGQWVQLQRREPTQQRWVNLERAQSYTVFASAK